MTKQRRRIIVGAVALLLVAWIAFAIRPKPIEVEAAGVSTGPVRVTIDAEATTRLKDRYTISAPAAGVVSRITLEQGDLVRSGTVVARLNPAPLDPTTRAQTQSQLTAAAALHQAAETTAEQARHVLDLARRTTERTRRLFEAGGASRAQLDEAEAALSNAERQYEAAQSRARAAAADVQALRTALALGTGAGAGAAIPVRAPATGRVLRVYEQSQRAVQPGTPLIDIGDPAGLEVVAEVLSTDAVRIQPGQTMLLDDWGGKDTLQAEVRTVGPGAFTRISALGVEEQRVQVVGAMSNPPPSLGDGYRVTARIVVWERSGELRAPTAALFRRDDAWAVFRIVDNRARLTTVRIGERGAEWAQVIEGLSEGDRVILYPSDRVAEGVLVHALAE